MAVSLYSLSPRGLEADLIKIEVEHYRSQPGMVIVGLADTAVQESRERVRAAMKNSGLSFPRGKVVVNLAPADIRKSGPAYDLPIALALVHIEKPLDEFSDTLFFGELALDGKLRGIHGVLSLMDCAKKLGFQRVFLPRVHLEEALLISGLTIIPVDSLSHAVQIFRAERDPESFTQTSLKKYFQSSAAPEIDFSEIHGQTHAKRALEIAAAGSHNILLRGPPGSGKTLMGRALAGILPPLEIDESLEVSKIHSLASVLPSTEPLLHHRPFRILHPSASIAAVLGGGRSLKPGEISLAHRGVLFLDEMPEFPSHILESLRQPLEDRRITLSRLHGSVEYPSQFLLCGAMNPCPCGYFGVQHSKKVCSCTPYLVTRYQKKISGPLLDRMDLFCDVPMIKAHELESGVPESTTVIRERVLQARNFSALRFQELHIHSNSELKPRHCKNMCALSPSSSELLSRAFDQLGLSARSYHKILKVSRTIADLAQSENILEEHVLEALQFRKGA